VAEELVEVGALRESESFAFGVELGEQGEGSAPLVFGGAGFPFALGSDAW
jgi:hypothetical protein